MARKPSDRRTGRERRDRTAPPPGVERRDDDRRKIDIGAPPNTAIAAISDKVFFRCLALALIFHDALGIRIEIPTVQLLPFAFYCFFIPDTVRGKESWPARAIRRRLLGADDE